MIREQRLGQLPQAALGHLIAAPLGEELVRLELRQVGSQRAGELARVAWAGVPEQDDLAGVGLDDLHLFQRVGGAEETPLAVDDQLVGAGGAHQTAGIARSPASSWPSTQIDGSSVTPSAAARASASASARFVLSKDTPLTTAVGCISQA